MVLFLLHININNKIKIYAKSI